MRTLIAIPCMDMVHTAFMASLLSMDKPGDTEVAISSSSLVYDARHMLGHKAVAEGWDRVLWLDSDMHFGPDLMQLLSADLDKGLDFVSALYFTRKTPVKPCVYSRVTPMTEDQAPEAVNCTEVPPGLFEIEGCGFGACMMRTGLLRQAGRLPFFPIYGMGEDLAFCYRLRSQGVKIWCDSRIRVDHIGQTFINQSNWR